MFANVAEAEKAAAMLRRFGGREALTAPAGDGVVFGAIVTFGYGEPIEDWEQVADFLLARNTPQEDRHKELLAQARAHLGSVRRGLVQPDRPFGDPVYSQVAGLCATLECLLEVLA